MPDMVEGLESWTKTERGETLEVKSATPIFDDEAGGRTLDAGVD